MINSLVYQIKNFLPYQVQNNLSQILWRALKLDWKLKSGLTTRIESKSDWWIFNEIFVNGEYDLPIKHVIESASNGCPLNILDIGANVGFFSLRIADLILQSQNSNRSFHITLIEGSPDVYKQLTDRFNDQQFLSENVTIVHGLVGKLKGSDKISQSLFNARNSILSDNHRDSSTVSYIDLNSLKNLNSQNISIDLLKCDIEGAELLFIENYQEMLSRTKYAVFEFHPNLCDVIRCHKLLEKLGFQNQKKLSEHVDFFWR
jgi:FkbM family methyltransferase